MVTFWGVSLLACFVSQSLAATSPSGVGDYILAGIGSTASANSTSPESTNSSLSTASTSDSSTSTTTLVLTVTAPAATNSSSASPPPKTSLNSSIASTGSGLAYASQCNALSVDYRNSSDAVTTPTSVTTFIRTITYWSASITTLCDGQPRIIGTLTPTGSTTTLANSTITGTPTFTKPPPNCSIAPSDCAALSQAQNDSDSSYQSSVYAAATNVSIGTDFSTVIVGSETTTYSYDQGNAPIITLNSTKYSPYLSSTSTRGSISSFTYYDITTSGTYTTEYSNGDSFTIYGYVPEEAGPAQLGIACSTVTNSAEQCGACTVYGGQVQMEYFPVKTTRASSDQCATSPATPVVTTCPLGPLTSSYHPGSTGINGHCAEYLSCPYSYGNTSTTNDGPYFTSAGNTYYQNRVYVSLDSAYASNSCGPVGGTHSGSIFTLATSQVYSVPFNYSNCAEVGAEFNFANLNPDVPFAAWAEAGSISGCPESDDFNKDGYCGDFINDNDDCLALCTTIYDRAYHPNIVVPTQIRNLDPAWGTCVPQLGGVYDPPQALTQALVEAKPTAPGASPTTQPGGSAQPASSPSEQPSPTAAPSPTDGLTLPIPKSTAEPSPQSSPEASTPTAEPESQGSPTPAQSNQNTPNPSPSPSPDPSPSPNSPQSSEQSPTADPALSQNSQNGNQSPQPQQTEDEPTNPAQITGSPAQSPSGGENTVNTPAGANATPGQPSQANQSPNQPTPAETPNSQPQNAQSQNAASPPEQQPQQGSPTAVIVGGSTFAVGSSANEVTVGSQVLTAGGPAQTIAGQQVSVASNGAIFDGSNTAQQVGPATQPVDPTAAPAALTFTANGRAYTAAPASGATDAYVVDGSQTIQMGSQATVNGVAVSAASNAFVVGGSNTFAMQSSNPTASPDQDTSPSDDAPAVTVSIVSGETNVAVIDGITNSFPQTNGLVNGHIYSWTSDNLVVDGSQTITPGAGTTQTLSTEADDETSSSTTSTTSTSSDSASSSSPTRSTGTPTSSGSATGQTTPTATSGASRASNAIGWVVIALIGLYYGL